MQKNFVCVYIFLFSEFYQTTVRWSRITDKPAINRQNFAQVRLWTKFIFWIRLYIVIKLSDHLESELLREVERVHRSGRGGLSHGMKGHGDK